MPDPRATASGVEGASPLALEIRGLSKSFAGVAALKSIDLSLDPGEIRGLLGHNGSGKSTLVKILAGYYRPDGSPAIRVNGRELPIPFSVADVRRAGLGFVHQDMALVMECSAADNLGFSASGFSTNRLGRIQWRRHRARAKALFEQVGLDVDPRTPTAALSQAQRALLAIARAQGEFEHEGESVFVLDEPTATLPQHEVELLFAALRKLAAAGAAILYISHRLPELIDLTDAVTILRDGRVIRTVETKSTSEGALAELMLGTKITAAGEQQRSVATASDLLRFEGIAAAGLHPTTLGLRHGEILAVSGAVGCGGAELGRVIYGMTAIDGGRVLLDEVELSDPSPRASRDRGIAYLPADRPAHGSFPLLSVSENLLIANLRSLTRIGRISAKRARREATELLNAFAVQPADDLRVFQTLSGGNQQKSLLAKWLRLSPQVLIVDEPTQGIDVNTRLEIYARLREAVAGGLSILWITSDFEEAALVANRVAVFAEGRLVRVLEGEHVSASAIAHASFVGADG